MSIFRELKRRSVFKVGAAYLAVAWLIAQVSELALGSFGAPEWVIRTELFLLAVGFPVALLLAWVFELTPAGIQRETADQPSKSNAKNRGRALDYVIIASLIVALGYLIWEQKNLTEPISSVDRTIVVLPFTNRSGDPNQKWFADGLTEEIINSLSRSHDLRVAPSTSSFALKDSGNDVRTIAESLGVAHVLEGSVRRSANTLRITVQLTRASDGFNLWSASYDRGNEDIIAIQEEIAIEISNALKTAIDPEALSAMVSAGTLSVPAYEAYLKGLSLLASGDDHSKDTEPDEEFARAVAIDPEFADAHYQRAFIRVGQLYGYSTVPSASRLSIEEIEKEFYDSIDKAIEHEDNVALQTRYRARRAWIGMNFQQALRLYNEYLELRPDDEDAEVDRFIVLRSLGLHEQAAELALAYIENGLKMNRATGQAVQAIMHTNDPAKSVAFANAIIEFAPDDAFLLYQAHKVLLWAMDFDAARSVLPRLLSGEDWSGSSKALAGLRQACADERYEDALRLYTEALGSSDRLVVKWLANKLIGYDTEAEDVLRQYDEQGNFHNLAGLLQYSAFDPSVLPNFTARIAGRGIESRPIIEFPFRCTPNAL